MFKLVACSRGTYVSAACFAVVAYMCAGCFAVEGICVSCVVLQWGVH